MGRDVGGGGWGRERGRDRVRYGWRDGRAERWREGSGLRRESDIAVGRDIKHKRAIEFDINPR